MNDRTDITASPTSTNRIRSAAPNGTGLTEYGRLAGELEKSIEGEVRFDDGSRALYAADASNYRQVPVGVVIPRNAGDVIRTVELCRNHGAPVLSRGGGTSLAGQCCNVAVVIDTSKYFNRIVDLDPTKKRMRVEPGIVLDRVREAAEDHHLTFGPDPATHTHCTIGGMIGNNSCGIHSVMAGKTVDNVEELEILTYGGLRMRVGKTDERELEQIISAGDERGRIYARLRSLRDRYDKLIRERYPRIPRRVSGYNLDQLLPENGFNVARALVGTEGTCVTVLEATLRLVDDPSARSLLVLGYSNVYSAGDHIMEVMEHEPIGLEGIDHRLVNFMKEKGLHPDDVRLLPEGNGWLMVEFGGGSREEADEKARRLTADLKRTKNPPTMKLFEDREEEQMVWEIRESGLGATAFVPGMKDAWPGWEDSAVPPEKLGDYLRDLRKLFNKYSYDAALYGHFGQGCVHCRIDFDLISQQGIDKYRAFIDEAADLVVSYGGSLSGEHGDGQARGVLLPKLFGPELVEAFREFKSIWDPDGKMNPGKVVDARPPDRNLRLGTDYNPPDPGTRFHYPDDRGSFARATLRCVGVGECRRTDGGTMCPSYMVTREEKHSTRGRARLLFEMLNGELIDDGWRSEEVRDALDLCLACKGCKGDCPVNVDMATYKAEFLSHYYEGKLRPAAAYSMGLIRRWARLASRFPGIANFLTQSRLLSGLVKKIGGIAPERRMPAFAEETFSDWFRHRPSPPPKGRTVLLWPDTFNDHFYPETLKAAVDVLESSGYDVKIPEEPLCCGRPLYDYGMLDEAKELLANILHTLTPYIVRGVPVVGLEPSCISVFRDELRNFFPHDQNAQRLHRSFRTLAEFLIDDSPDFHPPELHRKAVVHGHCHHKAVMKFDADKELLERLGLDFTILDSGCCGMAGSFGFEKEHYDLSVAVGERVLLPAVRQAEEETLIVTDGFSCRRQIEQLTGRRPLHLAEVLRLALHPDQSTEQFIRPISGNGHTRNGETAPSGSPGNTRTRLTAGMATALIAGGTFYFLAKNRKRHGDKIA